MKSQNHKISRRDFLEGAAVGAVGIVTIGALSACSPKVQATGTQTLSPDGAKAEPVTTEPVNVSETLSAEIVVVGGGISGLAATVQAAELGAKVILLEAGEATGGNGSHTEGIFAAGSKMQKEAGINITLREVLDEENRTFNYRLNSLFWKDLFESSAETIDWLVGNGVLLSGEVDGYHGMGVVDAFHWWAEAEGGRGQSYIKPMTAKAEELNAEIMTQTSGSNLIFDNGKVTGIYATKADGSVIQINCQSVILASGGYVGNADMIAERFPDQTNISAMVSPTHIGDGLRMATSAGGEDVSGNRTYLRTPSFTGVSFLSPTVSTLNTGPSLWVNQDGDRYMREDIGKTYMDGYACNAILSQEKSFGIFDQGLVDKYASVTDGLAEDLEKLVSDNEGKTAFKADTIQEAATKAGIDPDVLLASLERYNTLCDQGLDEDFNKPTELLTSMKTGPYYIFTHNVSLFTSIGGIKINRKMQVVDKLGKAISGLYAVGTDGCELYRETYTINKPGSMNGHNVFSGRTAAKTAVSLL